MSSEEEMSSGSASGCEENDNVGGKTIEVAPFDEHKSKKPQYLTIFENDPDAYDLQKLPAVVKKRLNALRNLQLKVTNLEAKFYEEVHLLECKYNTLYFPIHEKRQHIITGSYEPSAEECEWILDVPEMSKEFKEKVNVEDTSESKENSTTKDNPVGIPEFWLKALRNGPMLAEIIQPYDDPILAHLIDIKTIILESDPMGFVLEFHFSPNEYFSNSVLTKEYEMKCQPDPSDPFSFEGPEIVKCKGCKIDWKKGKNVTIKQVKKKQKHRSRNAVTRTVIKTVPNDSFFNFFSPPEVPEDSDSENYDDTQLLLTTDFEIGHYIRERIVPNAVLFYTGEASEEYSCGDEEEEEEEEMEDEEDESDFDEGKIETPNKVTKRKGRNFSNQETKAVSSGGKTANTADCKQQ